MRNLSQVFDIICFGDSHQWTITSKRLQYTIEPHTRVIKIDQDNIAQIWYVWSMNDFESLQSCRWWIWSIRDDWSM